MDVRKKKREEKLERERRRTKGRNKFDPWIAKRNELVDRNDLKKWTYLFSSKKKEEDISFIERNTNETNHKGRRSWKETKFPDKISISRYI